MSASSKKKLRNELAAEKVSERQAAERKEAKKVKIYTIAFCAAIILMVLIVVGSTAYNAYTNSGIPARNTTAATIGSHELSNAELSYYFVDAINQFASDYSSYLSYFLSTSTPLDQQIYDQETGETWADYFIDTAINNAASIYSLADEASANGHALTDEEIASIDDSLDTLEDYAKENNYKSLDAYIQATYGDGASKESFREYLLVNNLAQSYYTAYSDSLTYTDADLREAEKDILAQYSSFNYNSYYLAANSFLEGGTTDDDGNTTYSDEEKAASVAAAEEAAKSLTESTTIEELDAAIAALSINAESETTVKSNAYADVSYTKIDSTVREWITDSSRVEGDITYIPYTYDSTDADGNETTVTNGYYVVRFTSENDNNYPLANVRQILVKPEGGTYNSSTGYTDYTDDEMAAAKVVAEELLESWKSGDATEDSFATLANEKSADGDGTTGGLITDVYPGQTVTNFNNWCFEDGRTKGDTGLVDSIYGWHIIYYCGDSDTLYRDFLIENDLHTADLNEWQTALAEAITVEKGNVSYITTSLVLSSN